MRARQRAYNILKLGSSSGSAEYTQVATYADLPITVGTPVLNTVYLVRQSTGSWFLFNKRERGLYIRLGNTGALTDWERLADTRELTIDASSALADQADETKRMQYDISGISPGTTRTVSILNKDYTFEETGHAAKHVTGGADIIASASTTSVGLAPQATAPGAGLRNVLGIDNGETVRSDKALFDATAPADIGVAAAGTAMAAARRDHVHALPDEAVTYAKMQHVSATDKILGRSSAGAGDVEEISCTSVGRDLIGDATVLSQQQRLNPLTINEQTDSYTLALTDVGKLVQMNKGTANTLTVPKNSVVAFPIGTSILCEQTGAGLTTVSPVDGDVTINSRGAALKSAGQYACWTLVKTATNVWVMSGDIAA